MHNQALAFWGPMSLSERLKALTPLTERGEGGDRFLLHLALALHESPVSSVQRAQALAALTHRLQTNAYRPLIVEEFALKIA